MCLLPCEDDSIEVLRERAAALLGRPVSSLEPLRGGRNSRVFRVADDAGRRFALKLYHASEADQRDRLAVEYGAFEFLHRAGVRTVPRPLAVDRSRRCAVYEWQEGRPAAEQPPSSEDVAAAVGFLRTLKQLRHGARGQGFGPASEACFSGRRLIENLEGRRRRLSRAQGEPATVEAMRGFLEQAWGIALHDFQPQARACLARVHQTLEQELPTTLHTLSPSDFGFHNALRQSDGRLVFFDFEYFGWDDPAKTVCDFLLHPAMALPPALQRQFASQMFEGFSDDRSLRDRVRAFYGLYGLKWCLILLNEFLPADLSRRRFAGRSGLDRDTTQKEQLTKAQGMLERVATEYERPSFLD